MSKEYRTQRKGRVTFYSTVGLSLDNGVFDWTAQGGISQLRLMKRHEEQLYETASIQGMVNFVIQ